MLALPSIINPLRARSSSRAVSGFSMTELVIVISVLGVLSTIAVTSFNHLLGSGKDVVASERREMLNQALHRFAQQNYDMVFTRIDGSTADEMVILRTLQYRNPDPARTMIGSPYFHPAYNPVGGSSADTYRLRWTGRNYELLKPGTPGAGILMNFEGTDFTTDFDFPPNFRMAGR